MTNRMKSLVLILIMALAPLVPIASAHPSIGLSTDVSHIILSPGETTNITLTIDNNGSSIESYAIDVSGYDNVWEIIPSDVNVSNVIPTFSASTTIVVRLSSNALPSNSGTLTITVTEPDNNLSSSIDVYISVQARYMPGVDSSTAGDNGLVKMAPGEDKNLTILASNYGNVDDTILLSVDQTPDFAGFWANWTSNQSNNSSNNTSGNDSDTNNTNGNNTNGNNTNGNSTTGNNTTGNNTNGNLTGNISDGIQIMSSPQGWEVRFLDNTMDHMTPFETRNAILRVSIPTNANPGYYGFEIFSASAIGNFSISTILVVNVTATHSLSFNHITGNDLLPGMNTTSTIDITSLSTADGTWTWDISPQSGNCTAQLLDLQTEIIANSNYPLDVIVHAPEDSYSGDICGFELHGTLDSDTNVMENFEFAVTIGEIWGLSMVIPTSIKLDVDTVESFNIAITNEGTEQDTLQLMGIDKTGITFNNPDPITLERGESVYVLMEVIIESYIVGNIQLEFTLSSTKSGIESINQSGTFEIKEYASMSISGPADGRITMVPGENSTVLLNLSNDGTKSLDISSSISGLPNGVTVTSGLESLTLNANSFDLVEVVLSASPSLSAGSFPVTVTFSSNWAVSNVTLDLQISDRIGVIVDSAENSIIASPLGNSNLSIMITNLGTSEETFVVNMNNSLVSQWFSVSISALSLTLMPGDSNIIIITAREISTGAPIDGTELTLTVTSTLDSSVSDSINIVLIPQTSDAKITVRFDDDSAKPGEEVHGIVTITNLGTSSDTLMIDTVEIGCNLSGFSVDLAPSMPSSPIPFSCLIQEDTNAGAQILTFRVTSTARSDMVVTSQEIYTVEQNLGDDILAFTIDKTSYNMDNSNEQQTIDFEVCNLANIPIQGVFDISGTNELKFDSYFYKTGESERNATYKLQSKNTPGDCANYFVTLTPNDPAGFEAVLNIISESKAGGENITDKSHNLSFDVAGPVLAPSGMDLGFMKISNQNSIVLFSAGWAISVLFLAYIVLFRKAPEIEEEEEPEEEIPLGPNEVKIDEYNKVTCTECDARLGVPEDSEPPFRFTCPKCDVRIRVVG